MKKISPALIFVLLVCLLGLTLLSQHSVKIKVTEEENRIKQRNALQEIIDSTAGTDPIFNSSLKGKIVVLNISIPFSMAPGAGATKRQLPGLDKLAADFKSNNNVVFITVIPVDSASLLKRMQGIKLLDNYRLDCNKKLPHYLYNLNLIETMNSSPFPINMVFNKEGRIELTYLGDSPEAADGIRNYLTTQVK